jgi:hypothetical protein
LLLGADPNNRRIRNRYQRESTGFGDAPMLRCA